MFVELLKFETTSVEFSFDNIMYSQVDGIFLGSVLGTWMAGIFVGFHEVDLFPKGTMPDVYFRYVDDTYCIFGSKTEACNCFPILMNWTILFDLLWENRVIPHFLFLMF